VRGAAYRALAAFPFQTLEDIGALRPLRQVSELLLSETEPATLASCEGLVEVALGFEHSRRRR
jgi:hypothetical protein